jgi:2-(1,2-epoxy-1,2-dihydrophenyl)acetyl-CoA isomerase
MTQDLLEDIEDGVLDLEAWHHSRTGDTEDHRQAARAFVDKREPHFKGR